MGPNLSGDGSKREQLRLERVLGLTAIKPAALAVHPFVDVPLIAYPAGGAVILYNHKRNRQTGFLIASGPGLDGPPKKGGHANGLRQIVSLAFSPDGEFLAAGEAGHQPRVLVWDYKKSTVVSELVGHKFGILDLAFSPNMKYLVSVGYQHDGYVYVWHWRQGQKVACNRVSTKLHTLAFDPLGNFFVTAGLRHIKFWLFDTKGGLAKKPSIQQLNKQQMQLMDGRYGILADHKNSVFLDAHCHQAPDGTVHTYAISEKGVLCLFDDKREMHKWVELKTYPNSALLSESSGVVTSSGTTSPAQPAALPPHTFVTYSSDGTIRFWNIDAMPSVTPTTPQPQLDGNPYFRRNLYSKELLNILYIDQVGITKIKQRELIESVDAEQVAGEKTGVRTLRISPDGKYMCSGDRAGNIRVHEMTTLKELLFMEAHDAEVLSIDFSISTNTDSNAPYLMATASRDRLIHIFDIRRSCRLIQTLDDHSSSITAVKFSDGGRRFISSAADKSIIFRVLQETDPPQYVTYHTALGRSTAYDMDVDPSCKYIATACQERRVSILSIATGKTIDTVRPDPLDDPGLDSTGAGLLKVSLDPSGSFAVTSGADKVIKIWDFHSGQCVARVAGHSEMVTGVKFSDDCRRIISTGGEGCIFIWKVEESLVATIRGRLGKKEDVKSESGVDTDSVDDEIADAARLFERNRVAKKSVRRAVSFQFSEKGLPNWARTAKREGPPTPGAVPTRGRWAQRTGNEGVTLFSELSDTDKPIARFSLSNSRRWSMESLTSSGSSPRRSLTGNEEPAEAPGSKSPAASPTPKRRFKNINAGDIVVQDLESADGGEALDDGGPGTEKSGTPPEVEIDELDEQDDGAIELEEQDGDDGEDETLFVDPAEGEDPALAPSFVTEETKNGQMGSPESISSQTEKAKDQFANVDSDEVDSHRGSLGGNSMVSDDDAASGEDEYRHKEFGRLTFDEYLRQPVDVGANFDVRKSISANYMVGRKSMVGIGATSRKTSPESKPGTPTQTFLSARKDRPASTASAMKQRKEATAKEVERMRMKLSAMGITWKSTENLRSKAGEGASPLQDEAPGASGADDEASPKMPGDSGREMNKSEKDGEQAGYGEIDPKSSKDLLLKSTDTNVAETVESAAVDEDGDVGAEDEVDIEEEESEQGEVDDELIESNVEGDTSDESDDIDIPSALRDLQLLHTLAERSARTLVRLAGRSSDTEKGESSLEAFQEMGNTLTHVHATVGDALQAAGLQNDTESGTVGSKEMTETLEKYSKMLVEMVRVKLRE
ncbi:hypothetical protein HK104_010954 [Borealophlyctis nickersoniae]|nr:hypothetical protein HK104_010954 [Borealophlyctis nickersoniae]